jgi:anaerobic selenocysteine-containing dehydrogenase
MVPSDILKTLFDGATGPVAAFDPATLPGQGPVSIARRGGQMFATPSGKLEFWSQTLADRGQPGLPGWEPDPAEPASGYGLRLLTTPGYFQSHTAFSGVAFLRRREGAPCAVLHPSDAAARGLVDGQTVRLFNDRGTIGVVLHVRDEVQPGVILVPGQRPDEEAVSGTVNMLCDDGFTDLGEGATYQSTWLEAAAW